MVLLVPIVEGRVSSPFGQRADPLDGSKGEFHKGVDFAAPIGTPVLSAAPGIIEIAEKDNPTAGNYVVVLHPDGTRTRYLHLSQILIDKPGLKVFARTVVGLVGSTGKSTGPHLHFEVLDANRSPLDPSPLLGFTVDLKEGAVVKNEPVPVNILPMTAGLLAIVGSAFLLMR